MGAKAREFKPKVGECGELVRHLLGENESSWNWRSKLLPMWLLLRCLLLESPPCWQQWHVPSRKLPIIHSPLWFRTWVYGLQLFQIVRTQEVTGLCCVTFQDWLKEHPKAEVLDTHFYATWKDAMWFYTWLMRPRMIPLLTTKWSIAKSSSMEQAN